MKHEAFQLEYHAEARRGWRWWWLVLAAVIACIAPMAQKIWKERCPPFGPALFRQGLAFSVGLTLLPILLISATWVVRTLMWIVR